MIRVLFIIISFYLCLINTKMVFAIEAQNKKDIMVFTELNIAINNQDPILINVLKLIEISGLTSDVLFTPWNRAYKLAQTTTNSIIFPMYKTLEREKLFHWLCPITPPNSKYLYRLSSRTDLHLESLAEIGPSTVGVVKNDMIHSHLLTLPTKFNLDATAYDTTNINKLLKGRVDYIAESEDTVLSYFTLTNLSPDLITREIIVSDGTLLPLCIGINLNTDPEFIKKLTMGYQKVFIDDLPLTTNNTDKINQIGLIKNCH